MTETRPDARPVVRFAPSPTGYLHIGGARTALFNWLYAKAKSGTFLLRIEDTDRERHNEAAVQAITNGLKWLELDWQGEPVSQFARAGRHREVALDMLANGHAYKCFLTAAELDAMRAVAKAEKRPLAVHSPWRERDPKEAPEGAPFAIRLKVPREGETVVEDRVQGRVTFLNKDLDDLIILRSDGAATYNLAVVVDDHDMGVTHVIRGMDHFTNAARQTQIYEAMGWAVPEFAHVPLIHGEDGAKLSKRHGALAVEAYRAMGYLPAALRNYLVRLGWAHGDDEIFSTEQLIERFDLDGIGKSPARLDFAKLADLNGHYIRQASDAELVRRVEDILPEVAEGLRVRAETAPNASAAATPLRVDPSIAERWNEDARAKLLAAMPGLKERAKTLLDILDGASFLFEARPIALDDKAVKLLDGDAWAMIGALLETLETLPNWESAAIEAEVRRFAEASGAKLGKVAQPLRAALTGRMVSPPVFDVMGVLGREESLARLRDQGRRD